jgi:hypothetical protein
VPNWIDTEHQPEGMLVYRSIGTRSRPTVECRVVPLASVRELLPDSHPGPTDRRQWTGGRGPRCRRDARRTGTVAGLGWQSPSPAGQPLGRGFARHPRAGDRPTTGDDGWRVPVFIRSLEEEADRTAADPRPQRSCGRRQPARGPPTSSIPRSSRAHAPVPSSGPSIGHTPARPRAGPRRSYLERLTLPASERDVHHRSACRAADQGIMFAPDAPGTARCWRRGDVPNEDPQRHVGRSPDHPRVPTRLSYARWLAGRSGPVFHAPAFSNSCSGARRAGPEVRASREAPSFRASS